MSLVNGFGGIACDLDGVVYRGPRAIDHAVPALNACPVPVHYATNNASRPPEDVAVQDGETVDFAGAVLGDGPGQPFGQLPIDLDGGDRHSAFE